MQDNWINYLCEYYGVSQEEAIILGTRSPGRTPSLPGSDTCNAVSNMTMEDIWELKERKKESDIFDFYKDQGAWSAFRQTIRHIELFSYHESFWNSIDVNYAHICEYGCGVAPFVTSLLLNSPNDIFVDISLTDIAGCEHLHFAEWKLNKIIEERDMKNVVLDICPVKPNKLPSYESDLNVVILYEVIEHVPSPVKTMTNLMNQMTEGSVILENFVDHGHSDNNNDGPDLHSAASERDGFYDILKSNFKIVYGDSNTNTNQTRLWQKQ